MRSIKEIIPLVERERETETERGREVVTCPLLMIVFLLS
jgi:hypothetical protein